ncbi:MAG: cupin domain-containing protein [Thioalkalispiraceae bacterium]|jgi:quercetin dioxygenase-like cupin family protein
MSTTNVIHWNPGTDGEFNEQAMYDKLAAMGYRVNRYIYPPGTLFPEHDHSMDKIDAVLAGRFKLTMQGESVILEAGDYLEVPRGIVHSAEVIGDQPVVSLDAIKID